MATIITKAQIDDASDFLELVALNSELLYVRFTERYNDFNEEFEHEKELVCSPAGIMLLTIYYTKLYNCYLIHQSREIVDTHFWEAADKISEV